MKTRQYIQLDRPVVDNLLTTGDAYVIVPFNIDRTEETRNYWDAWHLTGVKVLLFSATTKDLKVKILGSLDGLTFSQTVEAEFTVTTSAIVEKRITAYWPYLQIQVKPAAAGQNGTLSVQAMGTTISSEVDTELTATIDPAGLATEATLADLLAKIIAAPSTEAKQDLILTALGLIATEATAGDIKTATEALAALISAGALSVSLGELPDTAAGDLADINTASASIDGKLPAIGQQLKAASLSIVPASDADDVKVTLDSESVAVTGPLTDTELRASDIKVTLDSESVAVTGPLTNAELTAQALATEATLGTMQADIALMKADLAAILAILGS